MESSVKITENRKLTIVVDFDNPAYIRTLGQLLNIAIKSTYVNKDGSLSKDLYQQADGNNASPQPLIDLANKLRLEIYDTIKFNDFYQGEREFFLKN